MSSIADIFATARLQLDSAGFEAQAVGLAGRTGTSVGTKLSQSLGSKLKSSVLAGVGLGGGIGIFNAVENAAAGVEHALMGAVDAAKADAVSMASLNAVLKDNDKAWTGDGAAIEATLQSRVHLGFSMAEQRQQLAVLVAMTKDHTSALAIERIAMDVAAVTGRDFASLNLALGKAYEGNGTALKKLGIIVDKGVTGYQLLNVVQQRYINGAEAVVQADPSRALAANMDLLQVKIGKLLLPVLNDLARFAVGDLLPALLKIADGVGPVVGALAPLVQFILPGLLALLGARLLVAVGGLAANMLGLAGATTTATAATAEHVAVEHAAATATEAVTVATIDHTAATLVAATSEEVETAAVAGEVVALDAETAAAMAATAATDALAGSQTAGAVAARSAGISMRVLGVAAIFLIPLINQLGDAGRNWVGQLALGKQGMKDLTLVTDDLGNGFLGLDPAIGHIDKAAKALGKDLNATTHIIATEMIKSGRSAQDVIDTILKYGTASYKEAGFGAAHNIAAGLRLGQPEIEAAANAIPDALRKAADSAQATVGNIAGFWTAEFHDGTRVFAGSAEELANQIPIAVQAAKDKAAAIVAGVPKDLAGQIIGNIDEFKSAKKAILDAFTGAVSDAKSAAANIAILSMPAIAKGFKKGSSEANAVVLSEMDKLLISLETLEPGAFVAGSKANKALPRGFAANIDAAVAALGRERDKFAPSLSLEEYARVLGEQGLADYIKGILTPDVVTPARQIRADLLAALDIGSGAGPSPADLGAGLIDGWVGGMKKSALSALGGLVAALAPYYAALAGAVTGGAARTITSAVPPGQRGHMPLPAFQSGSRFVPETGIALLHRGEIVIPAQAGLSHSPTQSSAGGLAINGGIHIALNGVGNIESPAAQRRIGQQIIDQITSGLRDQAAQIVRPRPVIP